MLFVAYLVCLLGVARAGLIGGIIKGATDLGADLGSGVLDVVDKTVDLGTNAAKHTTNVATSAGKVAVVGTSAVAKEALDKGKGVADSALGLANIVGDQVPVLGCVINKVTDIGKQGIHKGLDVAERAVGAVEDVGVGVLNVADNTVGAISDDINKGTHYTATLGKEALGSLKQTVDGIFKY